MNKNKIENQLKETRDSHLSKIQNQELKNQLQNTNIHRLANKEYIEKMTQEWNGSSQKIKELQQKLENIKQKQVYDFTKYTNEEGNFRPGFLAEEILENYKFKTIRDNKQTLVCINGVWKPKAESIIDEETVNRLGEDEYLRGRAKGAKNYIKSKNYVDIQDFQPPKRKINLKNGVYSLKKEGILPHNPEYHFQNKINYSYKPGSTCPEIDQFFTEIVETEKERKTLYEIIGYSLICDNPLNKAVMLAGSGSNGKSVFLKLIENLVGEENIKDKRLQDIGERFQSHKLFGKLLMTDDDLPPTKLPPEASSQLKKLTGGKTIGGEVKYGEEYDFKPYVLPIFAANQLPPTSDETNGFFRRWIIIEFPYRFLKNPSESKKYEKEKEDREKLLNRITQKEELEGLLAKSIEAVKDVLERKQFSAERTIDQKREKWKENSTPVTSFIKRYIKQGKTKSEDRQDKESSRDSMFSEWDFDYIRKDDLKKLISAYAKTRGGEKPSQKRITQKLSESDLMTGVTRTRQEPTDKRVPVYTGIKIEVEESIAPPYFSSLITEDSNQSIKLVDGDMEDRRSVEKKFTEFMRNNFDGPEYLDKILDQAVEEDVVSEDEREKVENKIVPKLVEDGVLYEPQSGRFGIL